MPALDSATRSAGSTAYEGHGTGHRVEADDVPPNAPDADAEVQPE